MDQQTITHGLRARKLIGRGHDEEPLLDYALMATAFLSLTGSAVIAALKRGAVPVRLPLGDAVLLGLATTRLSRLFTREKVTRPFRAPFTDVDPDCPPGEVRESARGRGLTRVVGELLTCPRCFGMWASAGISIAYVFAPGPTRIAGGILAASLISDWVNVRFANAREKAHAKGLHAQEAARSAWGSPV